MIVEILVVAIPIVGGVIFFTLRVEHRLTRLETKLDTLLKNNGIDPKNCVKAKKVK